MLIIKVSVTGVRSEHSMLKSLLIATESLAQQLCGPLYSSNNALSTSVASAIASATAAAAAAVAGRDPLNLSSYPTCAVSYIHDHRDSQLVANLLILG